MSMSLILLLMAFGFFVTGIVGALTGLGGGIILVPMLVLIFHIHMRYAAGASLIAVIATSSGAAAVFLSEGYTNLRVGMFLQFTSMGGGIAGAYMLTLVPVPALMTIFGLVFFYSGCLLSLCKEGSEEGWESYKVYRVIPSFLLMGVPESFRARWGSALVRSTSWPCRGCWVFLEAP